MKNLFTIIFVTLILNGFAQTAQDYLNMGIEKHNNQDYKGALREYNKAIVKDKKLTVAYYNRGVVKIQINNYEGALEDLTEVIKLDENYVDAYYNRAFAYVKLEEYKKAKKDLDKVIDLDNTFPNALTLRGQLFIMQGDAENGCRDFQNAKQNGDAEADQLIKQYCNDLELGGEMMMLDWPDSENWKLANSQETDQMMMVELLRNNETFENWTEIGTMQSIKGATNIPMEKAMKLMVDQAKETCPDAEINFIEKDETTEYPWILFEINCISYSDTKEPESQLYYIVQGKSSLYVNFRAIKEPMIDDATKTKWIEFFKSGKVLNQ